MTAEGGIRCGGAGSEAGVLPNLPYRIGESCLPHPLTSRHGSELLSRLGLQAAVPSPGSEHPASIFTVDTCSYLLQLLSKKNDHIQLCAYISLTYMQLNLDPEDEARKILLMKTPRMKILHKRLRLAAQFSLQNLFR